MESSDYTIAWIIYGCAAAVLALLCWLVLRRLRVRELAWLLQCWLLALLFTPWYVVPDEEIMAPALIVFLMDAITIDPVSGIRALIPLIMAMMLGVILTLAAAVVRRVLHRGSGG